MPRIIDAFAQYFDGEGDPLIEGYLKFTVSGTNATDKDTFYDVNETVANANPLPLDSEGRAPNVFGSGQYRVTLYDTDLQQIAQFDPVPGFSDTQLNWTEWTGLSSYPLYYIVLADNGLYYRSRIADNEGNEPSVSPDEWERFYLGVYGWDIQTAPYTTLGWNEEYIEFDLTSAAGTLTIKTAPTDGMVVGVHDQKGQFGNNNLTITDTDGNSIGNAAEDFICNIRNQTTILSFDASESNWRVY